MFKSRLTNSHEYLDIILGNQSQFHQAKVIVCIVN